MGSCYNLRIFIKNIFSLKAALKNKDIYPRPEKQYSYLKKECIGIVYSISTKK